MSEAYKIGIIEPRNVLSFSYGFQPEIALLSHLGVEKDSLDLYNLAGFGEYLNLNGTHYRFENISNNGDTITLIKDDSFKVKIGTQKGMIAPKFTAITVSRYNQDR